MCGRYILSQLAQAERYFLLVHNHWHYEMSWNVAPTQNVPVVRLVDGERTGQMLRWGLIPFFARGESPRYSTINTTIERLETGPAWRGPWKRGQRCILPASGFYEWHMDEHGRKQPFFIHLADQEVFGFAGIWDRSEKPDGTWIESCSIITLPGNELMRNIHNTGKNPHRMPAILSREDHDAWLNGTPEQARAVLRQYPQNVMVAYRVSLKVNSPRNNGPELIEPAS